MISFLCSGNDWCSSSHNCRMCCWSCWLCRCRTILYNSLVLDWCLFSESVIYVPKKVIAIYKSSLKCTKCRTHLLSLVASTSFFGVEESCWTGISAIGSEFGVVFSTWILLVVLDELHSSVVPTLRKTIYFLFLLNLLCLPLASRHFLVEWNEHWSDSAFSIRRSSFYLFVNSCLYRCQRTIQ